MENIMEPALKSNQEKEERLEQLERFLSFDEGNLNILSEAISLAIDLADIDKADTFINLAFIADPYNAEMHAHAGLIELQRNNPGKARGFFSYACDNGISNPNVRFNLAYSHFLLRDFTASISALALITDGHAIARQIAILSARCKHNLGECEEASNLLKEHLGILDDSTTAKDPELCGILALSLYDDDNIDEALSFSNLSLSGNEKPLEGLLARGSALIERNDFKNAQTDLKLATELFPNAGRAWSALAQVELHNFQIDDALNSLSHAVKYMPDHVGTWHLLAWAHLLNNNISEAKEAFDTSYQLDHNFAETHGGLATIFALRGEVQKAKRHIRLAEKLDHTGFSALYAQIVLLNSDGKNSEANALLEKFKDNPNHKLSATPRELIDARIAQLSELQNTPNSTHL